MLDIDALVGWVVGDGGVAEVLELLIKITDDVGLEKFAVDVTPMVVMILGAPSK